LQDRLNGLITWLNKSQYTIKAVIPKTDSIGYYEAKSSQTAGWGYGYGLSIITGFVVLAQREQEVSQEEYTRLSRIHYLEGTLPNLREKIEELQTAIATDTQRDMTITEKKKLIGGCKYLVDKNGMWQEFDSRDAADVYVRNEQAAFAARKAELDAARTNLERTEKELQALRGG